MASPITSGGLVTCYMRQGAELRYVPASARKRQDWHGWWLHFPSGSVRAVHTNTAIRLGTKGRIEVVPGPLGAPADFDTEVASTWRLAE